MGSMIGGSLLGTIGGLVIGTAVADALFDTGHGRRRAVRRRGRGGATPTGGDYGDAGGGDFGGDFGGGDFGGGDF